MSESERFSNFKNQAELAFPYGSWGKDNGGQILFYTNSKAKTRAEKLCRTHLHEGQVERDNSGRILIYTNKYSMRRAK